MGLGLQETTQLWSVQSGQKSVQTYFGPVIWNDEGRKRYQRFLHIRRSGSPAGHRPPYLGSEKQESLHTLTQHAMVQSFHTFPQVDKNAVWGRADHSLISHLRSMGKSWSFHSHHELYLCVFGGHKTFLPGSPWWCHSRDLGWQRLWKPNTVRWENDLCPILPGLLQGRLMGTVRASPHTR